MTAVAQLAVTQQLIKIGLDLQQLYLYLGLLIVNAVVNSAPLKSLAKVAKIGVIWHFLGHFLPIIDSCLEGAILAFNNPM